jgi:hypothetical protein
MHEGNNMSVMITLKKPTPEREPPRGRKRWTVRLIANRLVVAGYGALSHETVRQVLKKTR